MELAIIIVLFLFIMLNSKIIESKINFKKGFKKIGHGLGKMFKVVNLVKDAKNDYKIIKSGCV